MVKIFLRFKNKLFFRGESPHASKNVSGAKGKKLWFSSPFPSFCFRGRFLSSIKIWEIWRGGGGGGGEEEGESWQEAIGGDVSGEEEEEGTVWNPPLNKIKKTKNKYPVHYRKQKTYPQKHQGLTHTLFFCLFGKSLRSVSLPPSCLIATPSNFGQGRGKRHGSGFRRRGRGKEN